MKQIKIIFILLCTSCVNCFADNIIGFDEWKSNFIKIALDNNISKVTIDRTFSKVKFLPKVIEYDRFQPEFYEDTKTYIGKRTSNQKLVKGINYYKDSIR